MKNPFQVNLVLKTLIVTRLTVDIYHVVMDFALAANMMKNVWLMSNVELACIVANLLSLVRHKSMLEDNVTQKKSAWIGLFVNETFATKNSHLLMEKNSTVAITRSFASPILPHSIILKYLGLAILGRFLIQLQLENLMMTKIVFTQELAIRIYHSTWLRRVADSLRVQ